MALDYINMLFIAFALVSITQAGVSPAIPAARRTEYFFIANDNLGYKYGYDTGSGIYAKQVGNAENHVVGQYAYPDSNGQTVVVNYRSGPEGYIPEGYENLIPNIRKSENQQLWQSEPLPEKKYQFSYSTIDSNRQESSDELGKKEGKYSFHNKENKMDVTYAADGKMGFKMTSGNNAAKQVNSPTIPTIEDHPNFSDLQDLPQILPGGRGGDSDDKKNNGQYSFQYSNPDSSRVESSDVNGNIKGQYSYTNDAGSHDLTYIAGPGLGFQPTGGSLAQPNGLNGAKFTKQSIWPAGLPTIEDLPNFPDLQDFPQLLPGGGSGDSDDKKNNGAYSFQYSNPESSRLESSDAKGNIKGQYSYTNNAGTHDLSYIAGPGVGFQPTGGSLAQPNGLNGAKFTKQSIWPAGLPTIEDLPNFPDLQDFPQLLPGGGSGDSDDKKNNGAYSFQYSNPESSRLESSDAKGNIKGQYSYTNNAGTHDLSYIAGPGVGFQPTGGSLAQPNGLNGAKFTKQSIWPAGLPTIEDLPNFPDLQDFPQLLPGGGSGDSDDKKNNGAYSFQYSNPESSRLESSDAKGNIKGQYSYTNNAGTHDLSYIAGPGVGFQPTGGSLAQPNGLNGAKFTKQSIWPAGLPTIEDLPNFPDLQDFPQLLPGGGSGDSDDKKDNGAYSFQYSNPESSRLESSDAKGNIKGQYSYTNNAGTHDLSYIAGPGVGFQPTGGSLAQPNGLEGKLLLVKTSQSSYPSFSLGTTTSSSETKMEKQQNVAAEIKSNTPISNISDEEVTVQKFFPPGQHGKTGYVIQYKQ